MTDLQPADIVDTTDTDDRLNDFTQAESRLRSLNDILHRNEAAPFVRKENKAPSSSHMTKFKLAQTHHQLPQKKVGLGMYIKQQKPSTLTPLHATTAQLLESSKESAYQSNPTSHEGFSHRQSLSAGDGNAEFIGSEHSADDGANVPPSAAPTRSHPSSAKPSYRKRYLQMLKSMELEARQKKEEEEQRQLLDERRRAKLREKVIGSEDVGSKFFSATVDALKAAEEAKLARIQLETKQQVDPETAKEEERQRQREANKQIAEKTKLLLQAIESKKKAEVEREARLRRKADAIKKKVREVVLELCQRAPRADHSDGASSSGDDDTPKKIVRVRKPAQFASYEDAQKYFWDSAKHPHGSKVFMSTYPLIREELVKRGWVENPDFEDCVFDAKFVLKTSDIEYKSLRREQTVNHFSKASAITTKVGLMRSLLTLKWFENVEIDSFFPRCYDLNDLDELEDWVEDFKRTACQSLLSKFVAAGSASGVTDSWGDPMTEEDALKSAQLCILVLEQYLKKSELEAIDEPCDESLHLSPEEWGLILCESSPRIVRPSYCPKVPITAAAKDTEAPAASKKKLSKLRPKSASTVLARARTILEEISALNQQFKIDGVTNTWIIKPAGKSRGRGIICTNKINDMLKHMGISVSGATSHWVAQKYIENPFLINGKKFDIRQWVVVTDWNPVTIYIYEECYFRLCMQDYNLDTFDPFVHLSNNSIQSTSEGFETVVDSSMWTVEQFQRYIDDLHVSESNRVVICALFDARVQGLGTWAERIVPEMKRIIIYGILSGQHAVQARKNSFELFGYDLVIDSDLKVWLIEINCSPAMDASTKITERLCSAALKDIVKLVVDEGDTTFRRKPKPLDFEPDTGGWKLLYRGETEISSTIASLSEKLQLKPQGDPMPIHKPTVPGSLVPSVASRIKTFQPELPEIAGKGGTKGKPTLKSGKKLPGNSKDSKDAGKALLPAKPTAAAPQLLSPKAGQLSPKSRLLSLDPF